MVFVMDTYTLQPENILGLAEIAARFNVPYSTALSWTRSRGFPKPYVELKMGPIWTYASVYEWKTAKESK